MIVDLIQAQVQLPALLMGQETGAAAAGDIVKRATEALTDPAVVSSTLWVILAAVLVFFMNAGFGMLETGLCRRKNAVNILSKNFIVFGIATVSFWVLGFGFMFGDGDKAGILGLKGFLPSLTTIDPALDTSPLMNEEYAGVFHSLSWTGIPLAAKFFFQLVFAATAATIVSGVVAERIKYIAFIIFSCVLVAVIYPTCGHWIWGGGWLAESGFWDFAGSTQVHSIGGWAALAGVILLGPRLGKYREGGGVNPIPGHNMALAALGTFILWLGWFGFNPGSTMSADPLAIAQICITTNMSAAVGALTATATAWILFKKPDLTMTLNGALAGLVAITAPCAWVSVAGSFWIGLVAGLLVVMGIMMFDRLKLDDPVGALSVHLLNGIWGTLAVGLFALPGTDAGGELGGLLYGGGAAQLLVQLTGVASVGVFVFAASFAIWLGLKHTVGIRVAPEEELEGLDLGEHGMEAYPGFGLEEGRGAHSTGSMAPEAISQWAGTPAGEQALKPTQ